MPNTALRALDANDALPRATILTSREADPTAAIPMLYREHVLLVPEGTGVRDAERVLRAHLGGLRRTLADEKVATLVKLAAFEGELAASPGAPICALTWKSWREGDVTVTFPASTEAARSGVRMATIPEAGAPAPPRTDAPRRAPVPREEILATLFEAVHELHFSRDALEGGAFCLRLANELFPCDSALVHGYDVLRGEFFVMCAQGIADVLLATRIPKEDAIMKAAVDARHSLLTERREAGRRVPVMITPVMSGTRVLGAIELVNPTGAERFRDDEVDAMNYLGEQLAEFIYTHGLVMDPKRILGRVS